MNNTCKTCPIDKLCNKYRDCVRAVYAAGIKTGKIMARQNPNKKKSHA